MVFLTDSKTNAYFPRIADEIVEEFLKDFGIVLIEGPK